MTNEKLFEIIDKLLNIGQYGIAYEIAKEHDLFIVECFYKDKLKNIEEAQDSIHTNHSRFFFLLQEEQKVKTFLSIIDAKEV